MRPDSKLRDTPVFYFVGNEDNILPEGSTEPGVIINGKNVRAKSVLVAMTPYENLVCMYDYLPNNMTWVRNTALEDDHWMIGFDSYRTIFEEVTKEEALKMALSMPDFNKFIVAYLKREINEDSFTMAEIFPDTVEKS